MDEQREHRWNGDRLIELEAPPFLSLDMEEEAPGPRPQPLQGGHERGGVRTSPGRAALAAVRLVAGSRAASAGLRCGPSPRWVCGLVRAVRDLVESHPDRPARWGTRGLRALGPAAADGGPGDAADPVGAGIHAGRLTRVVPLGGDGR